MNDLKQIYNSFLKEVEGELQKWLDDYDKLSFSQKIAFQRKLDVANQVRTILNKPQYDIGATIKDRVMIQGSNGYNSVYYSLESGYNLDLNFSFLDEKYLEKLVEIPVSGKTFSTRTKYYSKQLANQTTQALIRGISNGYGFGQIALELKTISDANYWQSMRIMRTESGRVRGITTQQAYEETQNKGVDLKKQWMATEDGRTRSDHRVLDGQVREVDEDFEISGHKAKGPHLFGVAEEDINCRCTTVTVVNGIAPKLKREGESFYQKKYDDWLKEQNKKATQIAKKNEFSKVKLDEFEKACDKWYNEITDKEKEAVYEYTSLKFGDINNALRSGYTANPVLKQYIKDLSKALDKYSLDKAIIAYRGMKLEELDEIIKSGINKAYTSVSTELGIAKEFEFQHANSIVVEIHIPKDSKGAYIGHHSGSGDEAEFLLDKGTRFKHIQNGGTHILEVINE